MANKKLSLTSGQAGGASRWGLRCAAYCMTELLNHDDFRLAGRYSW